jgi:hypothetical protein
VPATGQRKGAAPSAAAARQYAEDPEAICSRAKVSAISHLAPRVDADEFTLMLEDYSVTDIAALTNAQADQLRKRLLAIGERS